MKVLILHASAGAGHKRAAEALAKAFAQEQPGTEVLVQDILDFTNPIFRRTYAKGYLDIVKTVPELWGYMYAQSDKTADVQWRKNVRTFFNKVHAVKFRMFFKKFKPDIVICTHFMALEIISAWKRKEKTDVPLYCVVTDFAVHGLWMVENVDRYYVATDEARRQLLRKGQPDSKIKVTGIPVDPVFSKCEDSKVVRVRMGLDKDIPVVLVLGGGYGVGPTVELIRAFKGADFKCQLVVVAGANKEMEKKADAALKDVGMPGKVFGFVNNMHELMDAADLIVSKPGGLTTSELLAKGKPMMAVDPIPGQEQRNCEYLLEAGAAVRLYEAEDAPFKIKALLGNPARLASMKANAKNEGHPGAAVDIVRDVLK